MSDDTNPGGESLTIDQAAAAFLKSTSEAVPTDHAKDEKVEKDDIEAADDELQASEEDVGEADEGDTSEQDHADDGEDDDQKQDSEKGRFVPDDARVRIVNPDGTPGFSTVAELKRGSLREADYTQKTQAVSAQSAAIKERETQLEQNTKYVTDLLKTVIPGPPDPAMLKIDPVAYMEQEVLHKQWMQHLQYLDGQRQQTESARKAEADKSEQEIAQREWDALAKAVPSFKDEAKVRAFGDDVKKYGASYGFKPEELRQAVLLDHRQALVLRKAIAWDKLQASKVAVAQKVEGRPPVTKGGARISPSQQKGRAVSDALARLKSSGTEADAAAAYLASRKTG